MTRAVPEWKGKHDDQAIPLLVRDRIAKKANGYCQHCTREIVGKLRAEIDHIVPLILGGPHAESNLRLVCHECHAAKTKLDVKLKTKDIHVRAKHRGYATRKGPKIQSRGFEKRPPQHTASRPIERRT